MSSLVAMTVTRQRPIGLLRGEGTFLAWDMVSGRTGPPKALTSVVPYSVCGDAAPQHIHEHSSTCLITVGILRMPDAVRASPLVSAIPVQINRSTTPE